MLSLLLVTAIGLFAGVVGTGTGGLVASMVRLPGQVGFSATLGFSGGIMLSVVAFSLMPAAFEVGGMVAPVFGLLAGALLIALVDWFVPHIHFLSSDRESSKFIRTGVLIALGVAMHNLPEGLAIGGGYAASQHLGLGVAVLMALHNFPEGMAMVAPMACAGIRPMKLVAVSALAGVPMGVGALVGGVVGTVSSVVLAFLLGFAAGAMLFIVCDELIPGAHEMGKGHSATYGILVGVIAGIVLSKLLELT